jgi:hypothetical protein
MMKLKSNWKFTKIERKKMKKKKESNKEWNWKQIENLQKDQWQKLQIKRMKTNTKISLRGLPWNFKCQAWISREERGRRKKIDCRH